MSGKRNDISEQEENIFLKKKKNTVQSRMKFAKNPRFDSTSKSLFCSQCDDEDESIGLDEW